MLLIILIKTYYIERVSSQPGATVARARPPVPFVIMHAATNLALLFGERQTRNKKLISFRGRVVASYRWLASYVHVPKIPTHLKTAARSMFRVVRYRIV